jgi:hypothetical protein
MKTYVVFSLNLFQSFLQEKYRKRFSIKNNVSFGSFYPSVGSILNKISSKVMGKVNVYEMYQSQSNLCHCSI